MPELPEVQTVVNVLQSQIVGQNIVLVELVFAKLFLFDPKIIINQTITQILRRGKYIILKLSAGFVVVHLRMTGKFFAVSKQEVKNKEELLKIHAKHLHVIIDLPDYFLLFQDQRKFGRINFCENLDWLEQKLGPEPLLASFTPDYLAAICKSSQQIKALLLDQSKIAGLGNIYVDEVLWQAGVHPKRLASNMSKEQINLIYAAIREILQQAISMQGTTFLSYSFDGDKKGNFLSHLKVFNKTKQNCSRCGNLISKIKVAQRGTHVCEFCQR